MRLVTALKEEIVKKKRFNNFTHVSTDTKVSAKITTRERVQVRSTIGVNYGNCCDSGET